MCAAKHGHAKTVTLLLNNGARIYINEKDLQGYTALKHAACKGHTEIVAELLNNKANIHEKDNVGHNAYMHAAYCSHTATVSLLLNW